MIHASELPVAWHKSSYSANNGGNCVEVGASTLPVTWRKSSHSTNGGNCLEVGEGITHVVPLRDSKDPHGPALMLAPSAFTAFVTAVREGEFT
ncbi:DUF397 domain-containing protein [Streptomyces sp. NPDC001889]